MLVDYNSAKYAIFEANKKEWESQSPQKFGKFKLSKLKNGYSRTTRVSR